DAVDADAVAGVVRRQAHGGQHQRRVGGAAGQVRAGGALAAVADDVHHDAVERARRAVGGARPHARQHGVLHVDVGEELGVHGGAPLGGVQVFGLVAARGAGAVDQDVDRADIGLDALDD